MRKYMMTAASVLLCSGAALLGLPGCEDNDNDEQGTGIIGGNVVSFHSAAPAAARLAAAVQGVEVTASGPVTQTVTTDENGVFSFPDLPPGDYTLSFRYNGMDASYTLNGAPAVLTLGENQQILLVDINIEDGAVTVGHVLVCNIGDECVPPPEPGMLPAPRLLSPPDGSIVFLEEDAEPARRAPVAKVEEDVIELTASRQASVSLEWKAVPGAVAYVVEVQRDVSQDALRVIEPSYARVEKKLVKATHFTASLGTGAYRWHVWALDETGHPGRKSDWWYFTILSLADLSVQERLIFCNWNVDGVAGGGNQPSFTIDESMAVTLVANYHFTGNGLPGGTIQLVRQQDGKTYLDEGVDVVAGVVWVINNKNPGVYEDYRAALGTITPSASYPVLPAGTYTVVDSNPGTWSCNVGSGGSGFSQIQGYRISELVP